MLLVVGAAALLGVGCATKVDGPTPTITSITPQVVCNTSPSSTVTVNGTGLSALPVGGLAGTPSLAVPRVYLQRTEDLMGMPVTGEDEIPLDDPADPASSHQRALGDTQMQLVLTQEQALQPGIYSVRILSPSAPDIKEAKLKNALIVVPGMVIGKVTTASGAPKACSAVSAQKVSITGDGFAVVGATPPTVTMVPKAGGDSKSYPLMYNGCSVLPSDTNPPISLQICKEASFEIGKGDLAAGEYTMQFANPPPADCGMSALTSDFTVIPPPTVTAVSPTTVCFNGPAPSVPQYKITGTNFVKGAVARLGGQMPPPMHTTTFVNETTLQGDFRCGMDMMGIKCTAYTVGLKYDMEVTNPDGCKGTLPQAVDAVGGPDVAYVDTPVVFNALNTPIGIQTNIIHGALGTASLVPMTGAATPMIAAVDGTHPSRINAVVPRGLAAGKYGLSITDGTGCPTVLGNVLTVVAASTLMVTSVDHPIGSASARQPEIISGVGFTGTPRIYLAFGNSQAIPVNNLTVLSPTTMAAVFPAVPAGVYDLTVVNGDNTVGVLGKAYTANAMPLPRIDSLSPAVVSANAMGPQLVTVSGANFRKPTVSMQCGMANLPNINISLQVADTTLKIDAAAVTALAPGTACTVRVTNGDDMGFVDYNALVVGGANGAVVNDAVGPAMLTARRAPAVASLTPAGAGHILIAVGGDDGTPAGALDTVETVVIDGTGPKAAWAAQPGKLAAKTTLAGAMGIGRYVYVVGGNDGMAVTRAVQRALLLDPAQAPQITEVYLEQPDVAMPGKAGGYSYRVAAVMAMNDADNPNGETLPSDAAVAYVPNTVGLVKVTLAWKAVAGAAAYRIYRSPIGDGGPERLLAAVGPVTTFTDALGATMDTSPVPAGSLTSWIKLADLGTPRESPSLALGADPVKAGTWYLYALGGKDDLGAALGSYEFLSIAIAGNGTQTAGAWTAGAKALGGARYQAAGFQLGSGGTTYVYVAGGTADGMTGVTSVEVGTVAGGGDLGTFAASGATLDAFGISGVSTASALYSFGASPPTKTIQSASAGVLPALTGFSAQAATLTSPRYLAGAAQDGAILFVVGGSTMGGAGASATTEWMVY